jgi:hypothetical protein
MQPSKMPLHLPREIVAEVLKAGYGGAVDRRRQASGEDDAVVLSSLSVERSATRTKSAGLQLGEFVASVLPKRIETWSLTSLQQRLVKTGGRLVKHARYCWHLLAESHLTRRLFGSMLRRMAALPLAIG